MSSKLIHGNALDQLKKLENNTIDSIVTDPPYGYSFMNKDWDKVVVSVDIWQQCLRVLKPGAFAFIMCAPRQDVLSRQIINLQDAGFETGFTSIYWTYASGFPKAADVSKLVDKRYKEKLEYHDLAQYLKQSREKKSITMKKLAELFPSRTGGITGCVWNWENGMNVPTQEQYHILKKELDLDNRFDWLIEQETKRYEEAEREILGQKQWNNSKYHFVPTEDHTQRVQLNETKPATDKAKQLNGAYAGFQPKPAVEVVLTVMKPLSEKSYVDQALANGHGVTWLDSVRIPYQNEDDIGNMDRFNIGMSTDGYRYGKDHYKPTVDQSGRFPANLLVSDDVLNDGLIHSSGMFQPHHQIHSRKTDAIYGKFKRDVPSELKKTYGDSGSFSRYFDLDKWFETTFPFAIIPKPSKKEKNMGLDKWINPETKEPEKLVNVHPTVKAVKLMCYLIALGSRPNDVILDPFCGSGTTLIAAKMLQRASVGIEVNEDYIKIAEARSHQH